MKALEERIARQRRALADCRGVAPERVRTVIAPYRVCPSDGSECRVSSGNFPGEARFDLASLVRS